MMKVQSMSSVVENFFINRLKLDIYIFFIKAKLIKRFSFDGTFYLVATPPNFNLLNWVTQLIYGIMLKTFTLIGLN